DTACSSSLVAMHVALEAIREGKIDTAVVGGVNMLLSPFSFVGFSRASMLSPTGLCKAFDASGDGYVRGEGAVAVVLRALDVARGNSDSIHAVVVGSGINQDGRTSGLSLPSWEAQAALLEQVYRESGVAPRDLAFVEAHGTGTRVGDPAEAESLGTVLGQHRSTPLPIGSVKTNIGHLEPASGLAGFVKSMLALKYGELPPSLHFNEPNPDIRFEELNLKVASQLTKLPKGRGLRHAGVNSFGFGGANAHVVLREPDRARADKQPKANGNGSVPLIISAHGADALKALTERYAARLRENGHTAAGLAIAAAHSRDLLPERLVVTGGGVAATLAAYANGETTAAMWRGRALGTALDTTFVFAGNGSQWAGMGLAAYKSNKAFRSALQKFDTRFKEIAGWSAIESLRSTDLAVNIRRASLVQPLLLGLQVATVEALRAHGLEPSMAIGHSVGEIAAAWCAGALDLDAAIRVVLARSRRQEITRHKGGMAAVLVSAKEMQALLERQTFDGLEIAAINSARSVTVAGPKGALDAFVAYAEQERWGVRRLDIDYPYHCALVDPIEPRLLEDLADIKPQPTCIPLISTVSGEEVAGETLDAGYWWRNVRQPVSFEAGMNAVCERGGRLFIEVSPRQVLGGYLNDVLRRRSLQGAVIDTLGRDGDEQTDEILATVARTVVAGGKVDLERFVGPNVRPAAELPNYTWQRRVIAFPHTSEAFRAYAQPPHPLLGAALRAESGEWFASIDPGLHPWLDEHRVEDAPVFPAAGFVEIALAAAREAFGDGAIEVRDMEILLPLVFDGARSFEVMTRVSHDTKVVQIHSRPRSGGDEWSIHVQASVAQAPVSQGTAPAPSGATVEVYDAARLYALAQRRGLMYGPSFRKVERVEVVNDRVARVTFTEAAPITDRLILDPTVLDAAFHVSFALAELDADLAPDARLLPVRVGSLRVFRPGAAVARGECRVTLATPRSRVADFVLVAADGAVVAEALQVRFRTAPRTTRDTMDGLVYRTDFVRLAAPTQASRVAEACASGPAVTLAAAAAASSVDEARDVALVLDAGARVAAYTAMKAALAGASSCQIPELVASGALTLSSWPLAVRLLQALSDAGLAHETTEGWRLVESHDLPRIGELVDVLMTRYPSWIAEATCLARLPEVLPGLLRAGLEESTALGHAVIEHLENGSPASRRLTDIVSRAASEVIGKWPDDAALRVLVIGASNLALAMRLAPDVAKRRGRIVLTDLDDERLAAAAMGLGEAASRSVRLLEWNEATDPAAGLYDLVLCARSLHPVATAPGRLDLLARALRGGGALLTAEPTPTLFADAINGQSAAWWSGSVNPDFPVGQILSDRDWQQALEAAGLQAVTVQAIGGEMAAGLLVSAVASPRSEASARAADLSARSMILVADATADSHALADLLQPRLETTGRVVPLRAGGSTQARRGAHRVRVVDLQEPKAAARAVSDQAADGAITDVIFVAASRAPSDDPLATLSRQTMTVINLAKALDGAGRVRLWIACTGAMNGVVAGKAPSATQAGLWAMARVIQNEFAEVEIRCVDIDPSMASDVAASRLAEVIAELSDEREMRLDASGRAVLRLLRGGVL
ncbi:MAG TPA: acyltransferase domain-containing protein, partial [Vineibacter sp.]|nr:acyltransferase domain-containing protein [Vineibacter sp.]